MTSNRNNDWQLWIDTGGTFTDCLALSPSGKLLKAKVLSNSSLRGNIHSVLDNHRIQIDAKWEAPPDFIRDFRFQLLDLEHQQIFVKRYDPEKSIIKLSDQIPEIAAPGSPFEVQSGEEAPILAARLVTQSPSRRHLPAMSMRLATTRGTNALLERKGADMVLFITKGFGDLLRIGTQQRPDLFALTITKPEPLYREVIEVPERISPNGTVLQKLDTVSLSCQVERLIANGIRVAAIAFMHSYRNSIHEEQLAAFLLEKGFRWVSLSSSLAPFIKLLPRTETAVVDAYLTPVINDYLKSVYEPIKRGRLHVMTSAGGLVQSGSYHAKDSLLSGPAGGVVGAASIGKNAGMTKVITYDMGGTSTDVARFDGDFEYLFEHKVGDAHLVAPALAIESVAAGGGSICSFDGTKLKVGPESASAHPGPACYGAGGPLTLTDVNLLLGRLEPSHFEIPIAIQRSEKEIADIQRSIEKKTGRTITRESILEGFIDIANERMADAIRRISLRKGYDLAEYALVAFGGAGAQHACGVAERLGIKTILIPQDAGLLSALGLGHAVIERFAERQILKTLDQCENQIRDWIQELSEEARTAVRLEGIPERESQIRRKIVNLRFVGQDSVIPIEYEAHVQLKQAFEDRYRTLFGHWREGLDIEVESIRVVASSSFSALQQESETVKSFYAIAESDRRTRLQNQWIPIPVFLRSKLKPGAEIGGPALVFEQHSATVLEPGWNGEVDSSGTIVCRKTSQISDTLEKSKPEVVRVELFTNRFRAIANDMGEVLRRTALSTNVKERLDFSCALLDANGELVVNAPHIPVHLGAMGLCVRALKKHLPMNPGDVVMTNHPSYGGSHLPDITVVTPVFVGNQKLIGYVANRVHHAEIGGIRPGSMPPMASCLAEEGVVIPPTYLFKNGDPLWDYLRTLLSESKYPSRAVEENLADLRAAVAANHRGALILQDLAKNYGGPTVTHYMEALKHRAETKVREALRYINDGIYRASERLDDGTILTVQIEINGDCAVFDFSGSADVHSGNMNATPAIVHSAVIYVLRLLVDEPLPLNEGFMRAIELKIPGGILNPVFPENPEKAPSIVGGNVETSQRLVDTLLKALGVAACSQGTMNNILFGSDRFSYYETVCGGCGAGPNDNGASAVHSHMTNTRITDPEIIEYRYPVRVNRFAIRKHSGGKGKQQGGDGAIREITFLDRMSLSVLTQHRVEQPYGLNGGDSGLPGNQRVIRKSGEIVKLGSIDGCEVQPGDRFVLETPGGGGFGKR